MLTNLDELVNIFIIHTKRSPLSPLMDRTSTQANIGKTNKESDGEDNSAQSNLSDKFCEAMELNKKN